MTSTTGTRFVVIVTAITHNSLTLLFAGFFRYDNDHVYKREGHADAFHKHVFDDRMWREFGVEHIGREQFPTLLEVIDELYDWWVQHRDDPLIYP